MNKLDLKQYLASAYGDEGLETWFDPLYFQIVDGYLEVGFPHSYFAKWFFDHFEPMLTKGVKEFYGSDISIRYQADGNAEKPQPFRYFLKKQKQEFRFGKEYTFETFLFNKKNYFPLASAREVIRQ
ncbi:MAG: chromosomal replication initiator DnaA, partial [Desulfovibrionales bacterium]